MKESGGAKVAVRDGVEVVRSSFIRKINKKKIYKNNLILINQEGQCWGGL